VQLPIPQQVGRRNERSGKAVDLDWLTMSKRIQPMEGNIAPEVRDETGPDQREFHHDALGEEGTLMRKSLRQDLAPAVALC
jgi:hypothetical protein